MLTADQVAEIRASKGIYRPSCIAKHYEVSPSTVHRIWNNETHKTIKPGEVPNIDSRPKREDCIEDIRILSERGMRPEQIAKTLNIGVSTVYLWRGIFI